MFSDVLSHSPDRAFLFPDRVFQLFVEPEKGVSVLLPERRNYFRNYGF